MTIVETINENYDRNILVFIFTATLFVLAVLGCLSLVSIVSPTWMLLPGTWWVGAMMVWLQSKYMRRTKVTQRKLT